MKQFFILDGEYFETILPMSEPDEGWGDDRVSVPQRPASHWNWDGTQWVEGEDPQQTPQFNPLRRWQFHAMLGILGKSQAVADAMDAKTDPTEREIAKAKLAHTDRFDRDDPLFDALKGPVGLTDAEIDAAWMIAKDLK